MASADDFPLTPDYALPLEYQPSVLRGRAQGGAAYLRTRTAPQRVWRLVFNARPMSDWLALEAFYRLVLDDYCVWTDPADSRHYPVLFASEPRREWVAYEQCNISVDLIEAVGKAPDEYAHAPLIVVPLTRFVTAGNSKVLLYGGYGFVIAATGYTDLKLDGVSVGAGAEQWSVPLGYHRLEVVGDGAPSAISAFSFVA